MKVSELRQIIKEEISKVLNEADEVDLKLTELGNEKVANLKKELEKNGLTVFYSLGGKQFKPQPQSGGSGWDAKPKHVSHNAILQWSGTPNGVISVSIGKDTGKAQAILPFVEKTFKEGYNIQKSGSADYWEIKIVPEEK